MFNYLQQRVILPNVLWNSPVNLRVERVYGSMHLQQYSVVGEYIICYVFLSSHILHFLISICSTILSNRN